MKSIGVGLMTVLFLLGGATEVFAHARLQRSEPRAKSTMRTPPAQVRLWFSERLEPAFSSIRVLNEGKEPVDRADSRVDQSAPKQLRVSLTPLLPGKYEVIWRVLSVDGHVTEGNFTFSVAP
jgi:methionine-rich copper-binding protein CopC